MKKGLAILILVAALVYVGWIFFRTGSGTPGSLEKQITSLETGHVIENGDIIFQESLSAQSQAIQIATKSRYSHCGIIYKQGSNYYVFEAVQPVKMTPLREWIQRGKNGHYVIKRLKKSDQLLSPQVLKKMEQTGRPFLGRSYDLAFEWSDDKMYCSELIWKVYARGAGIELSKPERLGDFDLKNDVVRSKLKERYGENIPMDETVISPAAIFSSSLLRTVTSN